MFEVDWTDYDRELVGERKARKEMQKERRKDESRAGRASVSTRSSSSSNERPLGFLSSIGLKRRQNSSKNKKTLSSTIIHTQNKVAKTGDGLELIQETLANTSVSTGTTSNESENQAPGSLGLLETVQPLGLPEREWESYQEHSLRDSVFSKLTDITTSAPISPFGCSTIGSSSSTTTVQVLGTSSFVAQTRDVIYENKKVPDRNTALPEVMITASPPDTQSLTPPASPVEEMMKLANTEGNISKNHGCRQSLTSPDLELQESPIIPPLNQYMGHRLCREYPKDNADIAPSKYPLKFRADNPDSWKPPDAWHCRPIVETESKELHYAADPEARRNKNSMDLATLQRDLRRMAAASPRIMLARLTEEWERATDALFYQELEMEKKQWMLSALYNLDFPDGNHKEIYRRKDPKSARILALFESQATASYLAALHIDTPVTHLASSTLSNKLFPNVNPLLSPVIPNATLSLAPNSFTMVHCLSLPSVVASPEIPRLFKNIHRCMVPGGTLHLALIDPQPVASSLGPRMRSWLENNLILSLEQSFRCVSPSKLFPIWLADSHLRGAGSSITKLKFRAIPMVSNWEGEESPSQGSQLHEKRILAELRSMVGRMLWREVWGRYVNAERWWWEDVECVKECLELSTYWEYSIIEAIKDTSCGDS